MPVINVNYENDKLVRLFNNLILGTRAAFWKLLCVHN